MPESHTLDDTMAGRRRRYIRQPGEQALVALTLPKLSMLRFLAELRFLSLPQIAKLVCLSERQDLAEKRARRHLRALFDAGLVDVLPVSRLALAPLDAPNDATLLYGSAPNIYVPTARGLDVLHQAGLVDKALLKRPPATYGPKNSLFLAHELQVRDVRVWLEGCSQASQGQQRVLTWKDGQDAAIDLGQHCCPRHARPDAWFVYQVKEAQDANSKPIILVGFVEVDMGTERGATRWQEKLEVYHALFTGGQLKSITGYQNARVLVLTPDAKSRCDWLKEFIAEYAAPDQILRFWLARQEVLRHPDLRQGDWQQPGSHIYKSLL